MGQVFFISIMILIAIAAGLIIPVYMTNRAMVKVVRIFRDHGANDVWSAESAFQLGIGPRDLIERLKDPRRDYKPMALRALIEFGIVRQVGDQKFYLSEKSFTYFCHRAEKRLKACSLTLQKDR
jgi:hypothetical protein